MPILSNFSDFFLKIMNFGYQKKLIYILCTPGKFYN